MIYSLNKAILLYYLILA